MPRSVACAVVRDDPPEVLIADDIETLHWVIALNVIAQTQARDLPVEMRDRLRLALRDEQWGEAVELWLELRPDGIDVYPSFDFFTQRDVALAAEELQFTPLFID